jgi:hypothetical protein
MKIFARVCFQNMKDMEAAEESLLAAGFEVEICWDAVDVFSGAVFVELFKDFAVDADEDFAITNAVMDAVTNIVDPYVGLCWEAGPVPDNYVPHSEDKALDCIPHGENKVQ